MIYSRETAESYMVNYHGIVISNLLVGICGWLQVRERSKCHICFTILRDIDEKARTPDVYYGHYHVKENSCRNTHLQMTHRELANPQY